MKVIKFVFVVCVAVFLASCAGLNTTNYVNNDVVQTSVVLAHNNYRILKEVSGMATSTYILGIGGLSQKALTNNSRTEMFRNANLKDGQAIINIATTVSNKMIVGPIYMQRSAITTGYIIEFTDNRNVVSSEKNQNTDNSVSKENEPQSAVVSSDIFVNVEEGVEDARFLQFLLKKYDLNSDGKISQIEANAVTKIDCRRHNLTSLKGIEKFPNLRYLKASGNLFTSVDLSENKKLEAVYFKSPVLQKVYLSKDCKDKKVWLDFDINLVEWK